MLRTTLKPHIRWMIKRDMPEVTAIESSIYRTPWTAECFKTMLQRRDTIGLVITNNNNEIVGHAVYRLSRNTLTILNITISPQYHRRGLGTAMMEKLKGKMCGHRRPRIEIEVFETNLRTQCFLRANGFKWIETIKQFDASDIYLMRYTL